MQLRKNLTLDKCEIKMEGDSGKFAGYASVFGGIDSYGDTILKGAFESSLRNNGKPRMFWNHDWNMPIGKWTKAKEDDKGLYVEGELTPGHSLSADIHAALKHGTLDGLSIGGYLKQGDYDETENGRIIRKWSSLMEISPVVFPADGAARIDLTSVKSEDIERLSSIKDFERLLRDVGPYSRDEAKQLVAKFKTLLTARDEAEEGDENLAAIKAKTLALKLTMKGIK
jgi:HK97 family phage prohead protease